MTPAIIIKDVPPKDSLLILNRPDAIIGIRHTITRPQAPIKIM